MLRESLGRVAAKNGQVKRGADKKGRKDCAVREVKTHQKEKLKMPNLYSKSVDILRCKDCLKTINISKSYIEVYTSILRLFAARDLHCGS